MDLPNPSPFSDVNVKDVPETLQLLDLPNEVLIAIIARMSFSKEAIINLRLVNRQLRDLLTDSASLRELRSTIATIQSPIANALRPNLGRDHTWQSLGYLRHVTREVDLCMEKITIAHMTLGSTPDVQMIELGLHLFVAIAFLDISPELERDSAKLLVGLHPMLVTLLRYTATEAVACFKACSQLQDYSDWWLFFESSAAPLVMERYLVDAGPAFLNNTVPGAMANKDYCRESLGELFSSTRRRITAYPSFFEFYLMASSDMEPELAPLLDSQYLLQNHAAPFPMVASDVLLRECWEVDAPSMPQLPDISDESFRAFHTFCTGGKAPLRMHRSYLTRTFTEDAQEHTQLFSDLCALDWNEFITRMLPSLMARARAEMKTEGPVKCVSEMFQEALDIRQCIMESASAPDVSKKLSHFGYLALSKWVEESDEI